VRAYPSAAGSNIQYARFAGQGQGKYPGMERQKGEYLDMDEDKRQQLDRQAEEYVDDVAEQPAMNAEPGARPPAGDADQADGPAAVES
jgi:hypothetical protein